MYTYEISYLAGVIPVVLLKKARLLRITIDLSLRRNNLRINGLLPIDAGIFQCIGVNPAGSVQASARLTINQPSEFCNDIAAYTPR